MHKQTKANHLEHEKQQNSNDKMETTILKNKTKTEQQPKQKRQHLKPHPTQEEQ